MLEERIHVFDEVSVVVAVKFEQTGPWVVVPEKEKRSGHC
jgi:hypothetical protein